MEQNSTETDLSPKLQTGTLGLMSLITTLAVIVLLVVVLYYNFLKIQAENDIKDVESQITSVNEEIKTLKNKDVEKVYLAQNFLKQLEENQVIWATFLERLQEVTPPDVMYSSFSSSEAGDVTVSAFGPSFQGVAQLIRVFQQNPYFSEIFVPSLSRGIDLSGESRVSFGINMKYNPKRTVIRPVDNVTEAKEGQDNSSADAKSSADEVQK